VKSKLTYQITRFGEGFDGRKHRTLAVLDRRLGRRLRKIKAPYTINGEGSFTRPEVRAEVRRRFRAHPNTERKMVIAGSRYDDPAIAVRSIEKVAKTTSALVAWVQQWVGRSSYLLGAVGPPGQSDCSSTTMNAVAAVYKAELTHSAEEQAHDPRIRHFHEADDLQPDDFVFLNYGRKPWPQADHVEFWVKGPSLWQRARGVVGTTIGSRPSTDGVNYYSFTRYDQGRVVTYGRWKG
jgi:hypothetical protein